MSTDQEILTKIVSHDFGSIINQDCGSAGVVIFKNLLEKLTEIYRFLEIENFEEIVVFSPLRQFGNLEFAFPSTPTLVDDPKRFAQFSSKNLTIKIEDGEEIKVWENFIPNSKTLKGAFLVYHYTQGSESLRCKKRDMPLCKIPGTVSHFSPATFKDLRSALEDYKDKRARSSSCKILSTAWFNPKNRIFFNPGPETKMRESLEQFLGDRLRGNVEVRPEQVVGDSRPVDIKITWLLTNKLALIEIKWLGKSIKSLGGPIVEHSESRALQGARQLATYLDSNRTKASEQITKGYLVIFDARRKRTNSNSTSVNYKDGFHYKNTEITFNPEYHKIRSHKDFDLPIRMFLEPICNP